MLNRRRFLTLVAAFGVFGTVATAHAADVLKVGAYPNNPPFEYKTPARAFEGFEIDVTKEVATRLGMTTDIADYGFQALFAGIASKRIDIALSSITITPERLKTVAFTQPYYDSDAGVAAKTDSSISSIADLKGKTIGVLSGSTGEKWAKENAAADGFRAIKGYNSQQDMFLDLGNGRTDAVVSDIPGMQYLFIKQKGFGVKARIQTGEQYGLMMAKDNPLFDKVNNAISDMKKDGTLAKLHKKWFGVDAPAESSTVNVRPVPKA